MKNFVLTLLVCLLAFKPTIQQQQDQMQMQSNQIQQQQQQQQYQHQMQMNQMQQQQQQQLQQNSIKQQNDVECNYIVGKQAINCNNGKVECEKTFYNFTAIDPKKYTFFAIGLVPNQENVQIHELVKFYIYPKLDEYYYGNFTTQLGDTFYRSSIYYSTDYFDDGFRISEASCYAKIVDFFRTFKADNQIKVRSTTGETQEIQIIGYITLVNK